DRRRPARPSRQRVRCGHRRRGGPGRRPRRGVRPGGDRRDSRGNWSNAGFPEEV
ncbi:MAG: hypothetical protein AVDCRST_MAG37-2561, partial [uncultured Rubrobacteraceae bacterium]